MVKAIIALIIILIVAAVVVFFFVLGGSDDESGDNTVAVEVTDAKGLGALHIEIKYNPAILEVSEVALGELGENGQIDYELKSDRLVIGFIDAMGLSGSGDIVEISFNEKSEGMSSLALENVTATDADTLYDLVTETTDGSVDTKNNTVKAPIINVIN